MKTKLTGVILAGGLARRMDFQDKGLISYQEQPMVSYAVTALNQVVDEVIISANRNIEQYQQFGCPVISDQTDSFDGPLAGIYSAMIYAKAGVLLVMPCDSPLFKTQHLQKLLQGLLEQDADITVACDGAKIHPVFLAVKITLQSSLESYLASGRRKLAEWIMQHDTALVDFSNEPGIFANINTIDELNRLEASA
jgi:molybdopterin-guanine dinucleotide biosynthesis protein A